MKQQKYKIDRDYEKWVSPSHKVDRRPATSERIHDSLTKAQKALVKKHGTPAEFAVACYRTVPGDISMDEAAEAVQKYNREWSQAG